MLSDSDRRAVRALETDLLSDRGFASAISPLSRRLRHLAAPIVVGVAADGSSARAVEWAAAEAVAQRCPLCIVHAFRPPVLVDPFGLVPVLDCTFTGQTRAAGIVDDALARARSVAPGIEVAAYTVQGTTGHVLRRETWGARLLVLGSRTCELPRPGLRHLVRGSLRLRIAASARCPVAVVPARLDRDLPARRIVVGIDGTTCSDPAVGFAFRAAHQRGVGVTAVHAWTTDPSTGAPTTSLAAGDSAAHRVVDHALARWRSEYPDVPVTTAVVHQPPAAALIDGSAGAALVVVGSRGLGRARSAAIGSVSGAVLDGAHVPVAVVRQESPRLSHAG